MLETPSIKFELKIDVLEEKRLQVGPPEKSFFFLTTTPKFFLTFFSEILKLFFALTCSHFCSRTPNVLSRLFLEVLSLELCYGLSKHLYFIHVEHFSIVHNSLIFYNSWCMFLGRISYKNVKFGVSPVDTKDI